MATERSTSAKSGSSEGKKHLQGEKKSEMLTGSKVGAGK